MSLLVGRLQVCISLPRTGHGPLQPGSAFHVACKHGKTVLEADQDRSQVIATYGEGAEAPRPPGLLQALGKLVKSEGIAAWGKVTVVAGSRATLQLEVYLPQWLWQAGQQWRRSPAAALVLLHLQPAASQEGQGQQLESQQQGGVEGCAGAGLSYLQRLALELGQDGEAERLAGGDAFSRRLNPQAAYFLWLLLGDVCSLAACFAALPSKMRDPPLPLLVHSRPGEVSLLGDLPHEVLLQVLARLPSADLKRVACTCRLMRAAAMDVPPGLKLSLFPHQRSALRWMLLREAPPQLIPHPTICKFTALPPPDSGGPGSPGKAAASGDQDDGEVDRGQRAGLPVWGNTANGEILVEEPPPALDFRGGLFCDEPGLGKTITALALILKTQGLLPTPPAGSPVTWIAPEPAHAGQLAGGPPMGYYTLAEAAASSVSMLQAARNGSLAARSRSGSLRRTRSSSVAMATAAAGAAADSRLQEQAGAEDVGEGEPPPVKRPRRGSAASAPQLQSSQGMDGIPSMSLSMAATASMGLEGSGVGTGEGSEAGEEESGPPCPLWVECHLCKKWRRVPHNYPVPAGEWYCGMTPEGELRRSCRDPQDAEEERAYVSQCPGWVPAAGGEAGSESNVEYFKSLLARHPAALVSGHASALRWLARQQPEALRKGFTIPREQRTVPDYGEVLVQLGLVPVKKQQRGAKRGRGQQGGDGSASDKDPDYGASRKRGGGGGGGRTEGPQLAVGKGTGKSDWYSWRQDGTYSQLRLDVKALGLALEAGRGSDQHRVYLSPATLVVVTPELIDHWLHQLEQHVQRHSLRVAVVVTDGSPYGDAGDPRTAWELAWECDLVITTFEYMSHKWDARNPLTCSSLMQVHWLRVILDEGHKIGGLAMTNKLQMATALHAERRWVMTGTPTPSSGGTTPVSYLQPLLAFLQEQPFGSQVSVWQEAVQAPFQARQEEGRLRLLSVLQRCMIRASKQELWNLPRLHRKVTLLDFAPMHAQSYNGFVDIVRFNLITSDWYDPDHKESLLCEANARRAQQTFRNLRLSCNVAGNCELQVLDKDLAESLWLITAKHALPPPPGGAAAQLAQSRAQLEDLAAAHPDAGERWLAAVALRLLAKMEEGEGGQRHLSLHRLLPVLERGEVPLGTLRLLLRAAVACKALPPSWPQKLGRVQAAMQQGGRCEQCDVAARVLFATPCGHLLCVDCTSKEERGCPMCSQAYVMQGRDDPERLKHNPRPKWDVPVELIEWQPAYAQRGAQGVTEGEWQANWASTQSSKCVHLLRRLMEVGAVLPPGPAGQRAKEALIARQRGQAGRKGLTKAIVFTQFWEHMLLLQLYLEQHGVDHAVLKSSMKPHEKSSDLSRFQHSLWCGVLLMDEAGSVGLDLSFVSSILLMEPIADQALEQQVVSRAHRMGARQDVLVETLAMKGTLEEHMLAQPAQQQQQQQQQQQAAVAGSGGQQAGGLAPGLGQARTAGEQQVGGMAGQHPPPSPAAALAVTEAAAATLAASGNGGDASSPRAPDSRSPKSKKRSSGAGSLPSSPAGKKRHGPKARPASSVPGSATAGSVGPAAASRSAAHEKQRTEADRRRARNALLLSLRPVAVADLPTYNDLPGAAEAGEEAGPSTSAAWPAAAPLAPTWEFGSSSLQPGGSMLAQPGGSAVLGGEGGATEAVDLAGAGAAGPGASQPSSSHALPADSEATALVAAVVHGRPGELPRAGVATAAVEADGGPARCEGQEVAAGASLGGQQQEQLPGMADVGEAAHTSGQQRGTGSMPTERWCRLRQLLVGMVKGAPFQQPTAPSCPHEASSEQGLGAASEAATRAATGADAPPTAAPAAAAAAAPGLGTSDGASLTEASARRFAAGDGLLAAQLGGQQGVLDVKPRKGVRFAD